MGMLVTVVYSGGIPVSDSPLGFPVDLVTNGYPVTVIDNGIPMSGVGLPALAPGSSYVVDLNGAYVLDGANYVIA